MMATSNSGGSGAVLIALLARLVWPVAAAEATNGVALQAERVLVEARARVAGATNDLQRAWELGRACFERAEFPSNSTHRVSLAEEGALACRRAIALDSNSAPARYYLAMNLGQLARVRLLSGLWLVNEMEDNFLAGLARDETFNHAGGHRSLGMLYRDAPGWPTSIGNRTKARYHLTRAVELDGEYPENRLVLAESFLSWRDREGAEAQAAALAELLPRAREVLTGPEWQEDWVEWDKRWERVQSQLNVLAKPSLP